MLQEQIDGQTRRCAAVHSVITTITLLLNTLRFILFSGLSKTAVPARAMFVKAADNLLALGWLPKCEISPKNRTKPASQRHTIECKGFRQDQHMAPSLIERASGADGGPGRAGRSRRAGRTRRLERDDFEAKRNAARDADPMFVQRLADAKRQTPLAR